MTDPKEHWTKKAEEYKKDGKFEEAIKMLDKANEIKKEEKDPDYWFKKAIHFCDIGQYQSAKNALEKDLETKQKNYDSFFLRGKILYNLKNYEESLECFNKASEEYNRKHMRNTHKIDQMKNVNKFEEAVKYSDLVYQEKEIDQEFWFQKGMTLNKLKKFSEASLCFETILEKKQNNPKILYELAKSELLVGNQKKSLEILEKACKLDSQVKEKLRIDKDFETISEEEKFQSLLGMLQ
ncbi:MAG: tetratricopeptide repeat protein [Nitrosopumilus sp.]|nr:tetratricopeptide repeat protein [Nitrosopumilus sp.]